MLAEAVELACHAADPNFLRVNIEILGNTDPFLHTHVWPRYAWEPADVVAEPVWLHGKANVAIEVRVCAVSQAGEVGDAPWSLVGADGNTNAVYLNGGGLEEPQYLDGNSLSEGECARGWVSFEIPKAERIVAAKYVPHSAEGDPLGGAQWALG